MILTAVLVAFAGGIWVLWERSRGPARPANGEFEEREAQHGFRLLVALASLLVILFIALVLEGLGLQFAGWLALLAVVAGLAVVYIGPWIGPRRPRRPR